MDFFSLVISDIIKILIDCLLCTRLRENIKDASMSDLRDFLENIRKYSPKIGEVAMRHVSTIFICVSFYICYMNILL